MGTVRNTHPQLLFRYLLQLGVDPAQFCEQSLLDRAQQPGGHISTEDWLHLLEQSAAFTQDPTLGLHLGESSQMNDFHVLGYAVMSGDTLADALQLLERYEHLVDEVNSTELIDSGDYVEVRWIAKDNCSSNQAMQLSLSIWYTLGCFLGGVSSAPVEVHFSYSAPDKHSEYQRVFGSRVFFDAPMTKLVFEKSLLERPIVYSQPDAHQLLLQQLQQADKAELAPAEELAAKLRRTLKAQLGSGKTSLTDTAQRLGIPTRTLQHRLKREGVCFRSLLDEVRHQAAMHYLSNLELSLSDIAFLLGYAEQTPFQKAFRRWTGRSPGEYRASLTAQSTHSTSPLTARENGC